jgi:hypothetical protein
MEYMVGVVLALSISGLATVVGFDCDRAFYPTLTIVIASYYGLFAVIGGSPHALTLESIGIAAFLLLSLIGFRFTLGWVVAALAAHGVFDWFHGRLIADPGVPSWWRMFCLAYDVVAATYLSWLLGFSRVTARKRTSAIQTVGTVPPSITYSVPVIEAARGETRKAMRSATSIGLAGRPSGMPPRPFMMICLPPS